MRRREMTSAEAKKIRRRMLLIIPGMLFAIIGDYKEGSTVAIHDINNIDLSLDIAGNDQLYAASIVAKALRESKKILANSRMNDKMGDLLRVLSGNRED